MTTKILRPLLLAAFIASLTFAMSIRAAIPPAEQLLPTDTLALFEVPDFTAMRTAGKTSPGWLFWTDPAMKPFHDKFMAKWNEQFIAPLEKDLGVQFDDYSSLLQGQFTLAVTQNGWNGNDDTAPGLILLLDAKDKGDLLKTNLAALKKKWTDQGKPLRTETLHGIAFSVVPLSSNDIPATLTSIFPQRAPVQELGKDAKPAKPAEIAIGQFESLLIVGNSIKAVEPIAARLTGGSQPPLAENEVFNADKMARFSGSPLYYGWFNAKTFFAVIASIPPPEPNPDAPTIMPPVSPGKMITAAGLTGLKSVSFTYRESHDGSLVDFYLAAPESGRQGLLKIIAASAKDSGPPVFVPSDVVKFSRYRLDAQQAWAELQKIIAGIAPAYVSYINSAIDFANASGQQKDPGFDIRKNLIGNLGDDFISYQKAPTGVTLDDMNNAPSLMLIGAANPDQAALALNSIGSMIPSQQPAPAPRDFLGRKIYTIPLPAARAAGAGAPAPAARALYYASSSGYVALTANISSLEEFLRSNANPPSPLREIAGLADAAQHVGGQGGGLFGYQNQRETMRTAFKLLKSANGSVTVTSLASLPPGFRDWMDFTLLPDYEQVAKYFYFSVYGGSTTSDGISIKAFAPRPPQLAQ
jgi:hypothetical protein